MSNFLRKVETSKAKKTFVDNYKGKVGKTTSIYQIGSYIASKGKRVLLIDLDPQCSLSEICLMNYNELYALKPDECLNYVYDIWLKLKRYPSIEYKLDKNKLIKSIDTNLDFIPSNIFYAEGGLDELAMSMNNDLEGLVVLQQFFQKHNIEEEHDYILLDCPPSNNVITQGVFLLSDYYIIPTIIQTISIRGVVHYIKTVEKIYNTYCIEDTRGNDVIVKLVLGSKPKLLGIFETLKKGSVKNNNVLQDLNDSLKEIDVHTELEKIGKGPYIFSTIVNNYEDIARQTASGKKCSEYALLVDEILNCIR